jgi:hypothetical protein
LDYLQELNSNRKLFFSYMKEKYNLYNNSNIFLRDIEYAIQSYFLKKDKRIKHTIIEKTAGEFINKLEQDGELKKVSSNAWKVNFFEEKSVIQSDTEIKPV